MSKSTTAKNFVYRFDVHPSVQLMQTWVRTLPEKTGRSLGQWVTLIKEQGPKSEVDARLWLKKHHNLGTNSASWLVERALAGDTSVKHDEPESYLEMARAFVAEQYTGKKASLRPLFDRLYAIGRRLGDDVKVCPCKTIVPLYRRQVFAQIKPSTNTRVDLGLCLTSIVKAGRKLPTRLIDTGGFAKKDRITHRIPIVAIEDIDDFVADWMARAYDLDRSGD